ncbi:MULTISPECIES: MarR family winged helix-turn-helix transcriptional regulator [unclassified Romboutsia]|uniref:MarR family winged helix-turn-helix transcriptional regulator n=1 Tax=unclassified Romboutsia TaxID=2626894 RepID=UPI0008204388|nr:MULTISPECIES: MarR family transcriptional regulator [unclassified Romboutsia]SCH18225.1 Salmolysin [uncultured Clostridium sp.]
MKKNHIRPNTLHSTLMKLHRAHKKRASHMFKEVNLTEGKPRLLDFLVNNSGCSQRELAKYCKIEPATATSILAGMEKEGLIYRERNANDKRILNVFLTEKGIDAQKKVEKVFLELDDICFEGFSEEEKLETIKILNKLHDNLIKHKE